MLLALVASAPASSVALSPKVFPMIVNQLARGDDVIQARPRAGADVSKIVQLSRVVFMNGTLSDRCAGSSNCRAQRLIVHQHIRLPCLHCR